MPVSIDLKRYTNKLKGSPHNRDRAYPDLSLSIFCKINQFQHIDLSSGWSHSLGGFRDLITGEVYTTFCNATILGTGTPGKSQGMSLRASYYLRNPIDGFYLNATLGGF